MSCRGCARRRPADPTPEGPLEPIAYAVILTLGLAWLVALTVGLACGVAS